MHGHVKFTYNPREGRIMLSMSHWAQSGDMVKVSVSQPLAVMCNPHQIVKQLSTENK